MRQALRCMNAMVPIMTQLSSMTAKQQPAGHVIRIKSSLFRDSLKCFNLALKSRNILILREALTGVAGLSPKSQLHDDILEVRLYRACMMDCLSYNTNNIVPYPTLYAHQGPVRVIVRLTLDRDYFDHETKAAAEQILVNIGFRDGLSDLEVEGIHTLIFA